MIKKMFLGAMAIGMFAVSCSSDDDNTPTTANLQLNLTGLENLGADYVYEGWVIVEGAPVTTGTFTVNDSGALSSTSFTVLQEQLDAATKFVLSIEPTVDTDPAPSETKLLAGDFNGTTADVSVGVAPAVGDFSNSWGTFFLRTPTDETAGNNGNDENGVWFGTPGMPPTPNLTLPELASGWKYEGWVVVDGVGPISTGAFADASLQVADETAAFSGPNPGPPVPGEDFFENAPTGFTFPLDVRGRTVVVTVEPFPDNSAAPFLLKPLTGVAGDETAPATHMLSLNEASFPTGTVTR